jgi:hypothetical protein
MKALNEFIAQENKFAAIFGNKLVDANNITEDDAQALFARLDSNLSPEALTSDGEAKKSVVARRYKLYTGAIKDLQSAGFKYNSDFYAFE